MCFIIKIGENMNNKGFTLIELLAVVILLITISLFVMPKIVDVIKDGDKTKENITKNKIIEAAKEYTSNYDTNFLNDLVNVGDSKIIKKEDLLNSKLIDDKDLDELAFTNIVVTLKENNKIEYTLSSNNIETIHLIIDLDGGKGINNTGDYATGTTITLSTPTKEDSVFSTWKVENGNSILSGNIITIGSQATTIKAVWTKNISLAVNLNGGSTNQVLKSKYLPGSTIYLEEPVRKDYKFTGWKLTSGDATINGNVVTIGNLSTTIEASWTWIAAKYTFAYTGSEQMVTLPASGRYKLEVWGAQGGSSGGVGGYSIGTVYLTENQVLYINVGGAGNGTKGGYNGGGTALTGGYGGGGATHIATKSGLLSTLSSNINNILIVAGGGGGNGASGAGGSAGGISGSKGVDGACSNKAGSGGTQTAGGACVDTSYSNKGSFGAGGAGKGDNNGGAGGAGLYGGGSGTGGNCYGGGGGGSSYIGNTLLTNKSMHCYNCTESSNTATKTISTTCANETPTENCAKQGNGYAKITYIGE